MPRLLITGASRGIGLEFVRQYLAEGWTIDACCRSPEKATALHSLAEGNESQLRIHRLDLTDLESIDKLAKELDPAPIDCLINNAAIYFGAGRPLGDLDYEEWMQGYLVNSLAPIRMVEVFRDHVARSENGKIVNITSRMSSIEENIGGGHYAYRASKAALNIVSRSLAVDLASSGIIVVIIEPGWVRTDMGGSEAPLHPEESVAAMRKVIEDATIDDSGEYLSYRGNQVPW